MFSFSPPHLSSLTSTFLYTSMVLKSERRGDVSLVAAVVVAAPVPCPLINGVSCGISERWLKGGVGETGDRFKGMLGRVPKGLLAFCMVCSVYHPELLPVI